MILNKLNIISKNEIKNDIKNEGFNKLIYELK